MPATVQGRLPASCESKVRPIVFLLLTKLMNYWGGLWHITIIAKWTLRWCAESPMVLFFKETKGWVSLGLSVLPFVIVLVRGGISTVSPHIRGLQIRGFNQLWIKIFEKKKILDGSNKQNLNFLHTHNCLHCTYNYLHCIGFYK